MAPAVLAGLPRTGDVPAGPARRERSGKAGPGLARDLGPSYVGVSLEKGHELRKRRFFLAKM